MERKLVKESFGPINLEFFFLHMPRNKSKGFFIRIEVVMERKLVKESFGPINLELFFLHMPRNKSKCFMFFFLLKIVTI